MRVSKGSKRSLSLRFMLLQAPSAVLSTIHPLDIQWVLHALRAAAKSSTLLSRLCASPTSPTAQQNAGRRLLRCALACLFRRVTTRVVSWHHHGERCNAPLAARQGQRHWPRLASCSRHRQLQIPSQGDRQRSMNWKRRHAAKRQGMHRRKHYN